MIYDRPTADDPLAHADIIDGCPIFSLTANEERIDLNGEPTRWFERVIVLTQACDLVQSKSTKVLVALVHSAQKLVDEGVLKASIIRDQVRRGQVFGWYFLPSSNDSNTFPESIVDLRDLHTVPRVVLERLVSDEKRICRLRSPYREHLAQHFAVTYMRIGLPSPYETEAPQ